MPFDKKCRLCFAYSYRIQRNLFGDNPGAMHFFASAPWVGAFFIIWILMAEKRYILFDILSDEVRKEKML